MSLVTLPPGVLDRIVEVLEPEEVWLFGSRARRTHAPDSDWDLMAVLSDSAPDHRLDLAVVWSEVRDLRRLRIEVIPIRRRDFEENRDTPGELVEAVVREGQLVYGRAGVSIQDREEIEHRAAEARGGCVPGLTWNELKQDLLK